MGTNFGTGTVAADVPPLACAVVQVSFGFQQLDNASNEMSTFSKSSRGHLAHLQAGAAIGDGIKEGLKAAGDGIKNGLLSMSFSISLALVASSFIIAR
jgi:hypothetical protein